MNFITFLLWLFFVEIAIGVGLVIFLVVAHNRDRTKLIQEYENRLELLGNRYRTDMQDLWDRCMATSYAEYEAYKNPAVKKPSESSNYLKQQIDKANRDYGNSRFDKQV